MFRRLSDLGGAAIDERVCNGSLRDLVQGEQRLAAQAAQCSATRSGDCVKVQAKLAAVRARLSGERAQCLQTQRLKRKQELYEARSQRMNLKASIDAKKQEMKRQQLETRMQRQQYKMGKVELHKARMEAGIRPLSTTLAIGGALAAAAAFFIF